MTRRDRTNDPHHVYRCYDRDDRLVYVGSTTDLFGRLKTHQVGAWWAPQVVRVHAEYYPDGVRARQAETRAIREEVPRWNKQGKWAGRGIWTQQDWHDWITTLVRDERLTNQLETAVRDYRSLFSMAVPDDLLDQIGELRDQAAARQAKWDAELIRRAEESAARDTAELRELNAELSALMARQEALARALGIDWHDPELCNPETAIDAALAAQQRELRAQASA